MDDTVPKNNSPENDTSAQDASGATVTLAGGTGDMGLRIARALVARGATVRALVRAASDAGDVNALRQAGAEPVAVDFGDAPALAGACEGSACVVSALAGLEGVIVGAQTQLLEAATEAGVPRFIPSDYSTDYRPLPTGLNRNFDLRRRFRARLNASSIQATSVFNGAFMDVLTETAPILLPRLRRVVYWGETPDTPLDFTTRDDTAGVTAAAALDPGAPRNLVVAGSRVSAYELSEIMTELTGHRHKLWRAGSLRTLEWIVRAVRKLFPQEGAVTPAWQGMAYMHDMFDGRGQQRPLENDRYPDLEWTSVREVLASRRA